MDKLYVALGIGVVAVAVLVILWFVFLRTDDTHQQANTGDGTSQRAAPAGVDEHGAHRLQRLQWSLQALARPASEQLSLYPDFVCPGDELALEFDEHYRAVRAQRSAVRTNVPRTGRS